MIYFLLATTRNIELTILGVKKNYATSLMREAKLAKLGPKLVKYL